MKYNFFYIPHYIGLFLVVLVSGLLLGCTNSNESNGYASIDGTVQTMGMSSYPNGIKITLQKVGDNTVKHIASTDLSGRFKFERIEYGTYTIDAEKEGMDWVWMVVDGEPRPQNHHDGHLLSLYDEQTKQVEILLNGGYANNSLTITDINGIPLNELVVSKGIGTVSFRLFNGSQHSHIWNMRYNGFFVLGGPLNTDVEYVFNSFNYTEGVLEPGNNITIVGEINPEIFNSDMESFVQDNIHLYDWNDIGGNFHTEIGIRIEH